MVGEAREVIKYPIIFRAAPIAKDHPAKNVHSA
jgi:hypothetical protein